MKVSIIIPTCNRVNDLNACLDSIISQTTLPKEIIIVDDSDDNKVQNLVEQRKNEFKEKEILLKYIRNKKEKSLTIARKWIQDSNGFIVPRRDSETLASRIIQLLQDEKLRKKFGNENIRIAKERADWDKNFEKLERIYKKLI